jgi:nitrogen regulatory protein P-II 1
MQRGRILNEKGSCKYPSLFHIRHYYGRVILLKKIEAIVRPEKISRLKSELLKLGIGGMTLTDVSGWSKGRELHLQWRGQKIAYDLVPKIKIEVVSSDSFADKIVECIVKEGKTGNGQEGDGIIFISNVDEAVNIATSAKGEEAIFHSS